MAELFRIKSLEWEQPWGPHMWESRGVHHHEKYFINDMQGQWEVAYPNPSQVIWNPCDSLEHGKQLASAHWRERLLSVLEPVETP